MKTEDKPIGLSVPNIGDIELDYVAKTIQTGWVSTAGPYVTAFEKRVADYVGTPAAVACQSGTAGLHVALLLCGVNRSDMVIVPTLTFIAAVNPVKYIGAEPVFMDCDASLCIDPIKLKKFCAEECEVKQQVLYHKGSGRRIPAMIVVHVFGNMADMDAILAIAQEYRIKVVEDATEALGTRYTHGVNKNRFAGTMGTMGVYSFNGNKIITTGGGGMIVSQDEALLRHAKHLTTQAKSDEENFFHDEIGYNYRLTNLQAALGLAQMERLEQFISIKTANFQHYQRELQGFPDLSILNTRDGVRSNHWFYALNVGRADAGQVGDLIRHLKKRNIQSRPIWGLIHKQLPYVNSLAYQIENAEDAWSRVVNLPCSTSLTAEDVARVISAVKEVL